MAAGQEEHKKLHIASLDGVRGLAILLVLMYHASEKMRIRGTSHLVEKIYNMAVGTGWCGVDLFFVLSGFLITGILLDSRDKGRYFQNFYMRRVLRIFPLFYGSLLVFLLVVGPRIEVPRELAWLVSNQAWYWGYLQNWLFVFRDWPVTMLGHFWSLAIEEQFYILWPLVVFIVRPARLKTVCLALVAGSLAVRIAAWLISPNAHNFCYAATIARMDELAAGALLAVLAREAGGLGRYVKYAVPAMIAGFAVFSALLASIYFSDWRVGRDTIGYTALALLFGGTLVASVALARTHPIVRFFSLGPMRFFGKYSYGIYVFHWPLMIFLATYWKQLDAPVLDLPLVRQVGFLIVAGALTTGMALVSWFVLEKRFLGLRRFFE